MERNLIICIHSLTIVTDRIHLNLAENALMAIVTQQKYYNTNLQCMPPSTGEPNGLNVNFLFKIEEECVVNWYIP